MSREAANPKLEAVHLALLELNDPTPDAISAFVARRFCLDVPPPLVPLILATLRDRERLEARRSGERRDDAA